MINEFIDNDGLVNEFALLCEFLPASLHCLQAGLVAPLRRGQHGAARFSLPGGLSDDNGKMDPYRLSVVWVCIASNRKVFMPSTKAAR